MKVVHIYEIQDDGSSVIGCTVQLVGKEVRFKGKHAEHYEYDLEVGIFTPVGKRGKVVYPRDGLKFLKALKFQYTGSRVRASDVITIPD